VVVEVVVVEVVKVVVVVVVVVAYILLLPDGFHEGLGGVLGRLARRRFARVAVGRRPLKHSPSFLALQEVHLFVPYEGIVGRAAVEQVEENKAIKLMEA
jgi:hypothetical protein